MPLASLLQLVHTRPHAAVNAKRASGAQQQAVPYKGGSERAFRPMHAVVTGWRWLACAAWTGAAAGRLGMLLAHI